MLRMDKELNKKKRLERIEEVMLDVSLIITLKFTHKNIN